MNNNPNLNQIASFEEETIKDQPKDQIHIKAKQNYSRLSIFKRC